MSTNSIITIKKLLCVTALFAFALSSVARGDHHLAAELTLTTGYDSPADRAKPLLTAEFVFQPSVFSGDEFPKRDFLNIEQAHQLLGDYKIDVTFYAKDYSVVEAPTGTGRYGAIVQVTAEDGLQYTRFRTLYKTPRRANLIFNPPEGEVALPEDLGVDEKIWQSQHLATNEYLAAALRRDIQRSHDFAIFLAGMDETDPEDAPVSQRESAVTKDRRWWLTLKRRLNGNAERFPEPIVAPVVVDGLDAPILREGTEAEAGMKPGTANKIHDILQEWANDSGMPFNAAVARKGVVFFNEAYGSRDGVPTTTATKHIVYSISKALSGSLLMTFVENGIISLDDPIEKIHPEFCREGVETPATFHHLFTHTADMDDHYTDPWSDLEHVYGEAYPYLGIGKQHRYNGSSIAIGLKALEQIAGLPLSDLYQKYLFGPLGCDSIESIDGSAMTWSNAYDLARVGQMLANHGAYGNLRFFSEDVFQQMLPQKLDKLLGPETDVTWGIGLVWYRDYGFSQKTIGHGSYSSCTLRVDLEKDLVITMTRQMAGKNFDVYHPQFIEAITSSVAE